MFNNPAFNLELILPNHQLPRLIALAAAQAGHTNMLCCGLQFIRYGGKWSFKLIMSDRTKVSCPLKMTGFSFLKIAHHFKCKFFRQMLPHQLSGLSTALYPPRGDRLCLLFQNCRSSRSEPHIHLYISQTTAYLWSLYSAMFSLNLGEKAPGGTRERETENLSLAFH